MATMKSAKGRYPSQEDDDVPDDIKAADESLDYSDDSSRLQSENESVDSSEPAEPLDIEAEDTSFVEPVQKPFPAEKEVVKPKPAGLDNATLGRVITGATPALMGLLMGASPAMAESQIKEGQKYYEAGTPKKTVLTMGPDGKPVYIDVRDSIGKEAFQKSGKAAAGGAPKVQNYLDENGVERIGSWIGGKVYDSSGKEVLNPRTSKGLEIKEVKDKYENIKLVGINPLGKSQDLLTTYVGKGAEAGIRGDDVARFDKIHDEVRKYSQPLYDNQRSLATAKSLLSSDPKQAIEQAAGIFKTAKIITDEKISDKERDAVSQAPSIFQSFADKLQTNISGEQRQYIIQQMKNILDKVNSANTAAINSMQDRYVTSFASGAKDQSEFNKMKDYASKQLVTRRDESGKKPEFTKEQWDALPETKKRQIMEAK